MRREGTDIVLDVVSTCVCVKVLVCFYRQVWMFVILYKIELLKGQRKRSIENACEIFSLEN